MPRNDGELRARAARDVPPGESWAFTEHHSCAEVWDLIGDEAKDREETSP